MLFLFFLKNLAKKKESKIENSQNSHKLRFFLINISFSNLNTNIHFSIFHQVFIYKTYIFL